MILVCGPSPERSGGVATWVRGLFSGPFPDEFGEVRHFSTDKRPAAGGPGRMAAGVRVAERLRQTLGEARPRLVHICCGSDASGWGVSEAAVHAQLAGRAAARRLLHLHASGFEQMWRQRPIKRAVARKLLNAVEAVAVLSEGAAGTFADRVDPSKLVVIPNGVEVGPLSPPATALTGEPLRLVVVGSVEPRKGIDELLDAAERVHRVRGPALEIDVFGPVRVPPDVARRWERRAEPVGVRFAGSRSPSEAAAAIAASDGLVLPSRAEVLPFVVLEAMAATRPVLATDVGAVAETLAGGAGVVVPASDPEALAAALLAWLDEPQERIDTAIRGWQRVQLLHTLQRSREATFAAWRGVLHRPDR